MVYIKYELCRSRNALVNLKSFEINFGIRFEIFSKAFMNQWIGNYPKT
nr:MAG TPA: hypothetical protein [Caudoviricetes sp.]